MGEWVPPADLDPECLQLCKAINALPKLQTICSCCGHGETNYRIWLKAKSLSAAAPLAYYLMPCHGGSWDWRLVVRTDCAMSSPKLMLEGPVGAYAEAEELAELIMAYVRGEDTP